MGNYKRVGITVSTEGETKYYGFEIQDMIYLISFDPDVRERYLEADIQYFKENGKKDIYQIEYTELEKTTEEWIYRPIENVEIKKELENLRQEIHEADMSWW